MSEMQKKSHIFILAFISAALIIGGLAFVSKPTYAGGDFSEKPYSVRHTEYDSSAKCGIATIKWSKAYSRMKDGTITDVSGYEIQYANNKYFSNAKNIIKLKKSMKATIKLKELNTRTKYRKYINNYHFRVRSFVSVDGKRTYSKWTEAVSAKVVTVYSPVTLTSIQSDRNTVMGEWDPVEGAEGYVVYGKKASASKWKKTTKIEDPAEVSFKDDDLAYSREYTYTVMSYRSQVTTDPASLNTSYLVLLNGDNNNVYRVKTKQFSVEAPKVRAVFDKTVLDITWYSAAGAQDYTIQLSRNPDFPLTSETRTYDINSEDLPVEDGVSYYTMNRDDVERENYYVRAKAKGTYKGEVYESEWSEVKFAEYGLGTYTIEFDGNGATSGEMMSCVAGEREEFRLPDNTYKRDGYRFVGWCINNYDQMYLDSEIPVRFGKPEFEEQGVVRDLVDVNKTVTLHACWEGTGPEAAADWAAAIAADDEFVYGPVVKNTCWFCRGGNKYYVCNAFVAAAYSHGMPYFDGYVAGDTSYKWWIKKGFKDVGENVPVNKIKKGDIISCWVKKAGDWGHIIMAVTDGTDPDPRVAHAAGRGMGPRSIREDPMAERLSKYKKYHVIRYEG